MKPFLKYFLLTLLVLGLSSCNPDHSSSKRIGIIVPIEHVAMTEIVAGFSNTLHEQYHQPITIKVQNAQGDANLQRAIIQQMHDENFDLVVPIGTGATEMTLAMVHQQPVVSLAADFSEKDRKKRNPCNVAVVHDEIPPKQLIAFIHAVYPNLTQLTLIHSAADKIFPDVQATMAAGKQYGITVNHLMTATLPELYASANALSANTQAIFILKDNLIASGIATLAKVANEKHIPLITSDQGSVQAGAGFSLGVHEREIGIQGGKLAAAVLTGKNICELPIVEMTRLTVFVNVKALQQEGQDLEKISAAAKKLNYQVEKSG